MHIAALKGNYEFAEYLIKKGAKLDSKDHEGKSTMHYAALSDNAELIEAMIHHVSITDFWNVGMKCRKAEIDLNKAFRYIFSYSFFIHIPQS